MFGDFMKKVISVLLCAMLVFSFCSCGEKPEAKPEKNTPTVILPDDTAKQTLNGYRNNTEETKPENKTETNNPTFSEMYYANKSSKKFHLNTCSYAKSIKEENLLLGSDRASLITDGYKPCSKCNP